MYSCCDKWQAKELDVPPLILSSFPLCLHTVVPAVFHKQGEPVSHLSQTAGKAQPRYHCDGSEEGDGVRRQHHADVRAIPGRTLLSPPQMALRGEGVLAGVGK